ncbi:MAG: flavodoxin-dependent (E)-4-hydroxy-3-methylbut-2-enyl-diphosphate synthase [Candidatus Omnitrophica bacterium]|nr:flavodoxin-dependent (E)-4-hydroxy-3-methylbut-2-enyl-diphosphate synthase [Candidatus Omnitrophota bacterium]MBL7210274.1 flavodoxin-dependent (E)-4-hydroxy-3-methylbut-2-enyl-diphosphate synthase [Candidatus Omnitrophota bacterium]
MNRHKTRGVRVGNVIIGAESPVTIQSMVKYKTADIKKAVSQIRGLEQAGCEIVRVAVKDTQDAKAIKEIKRNIRIPLVADIHFDWHLAIRAIESGADKIRLNPGNIYRKEEVRQIAAAAKAGRIPIRVGVNSGSVKGHRGGDQGLAGRMVKSALDYIKILEGFKFYDIVVSLKGSGVADTLSAYRRISALCRYPLHLGVTATGLPGSGAIKSSIALGILLSEGIGDTIRVSLTDKPEREVAVAKVILESLGLRRFGPEIISCPTCGRCEVDLISIVKDIEKRLSAIRYPLSARLPKLAVMGCVVNGPGEARQADIGIAFGKKEGILFKKGRPVKKVSAAKCADILLRELKKNVLD